MENNRKMCDVCKTNKSVTTITEVGNMRITPVHLCEECLEDAVRRYMCGLIPKFLLM